MNDHDHPLRSTWRRMLDRCHNPKAKDFGRYGARGITVCDRWRSSFKAFAADIGQKPTPAHTIDRIDGTKGYEPGNWRWATQREQQRNRRNNVLHRIGDTEQTAGAWAEERGLPAKLVQDRVKAGWRIEDALMPSEPGKRLRAPSDRQRPANADHRAARAREVYRERRAAGFPR